MQGMRSLYDTQGDVGGGAAHREVDSVVLGLKNILARNPFRQPTETWWPEKPVTGSFPLLSHLFSLTAPSATEVLYLYHLLYPLASKASKSLSLPLHLHVFFPQLSPSMALQNHVMNYLKHQMCRFIIKTSKSPGLSVPPCFTLTLLAYIGWLQKKKKKERRRAPSSNSYLYTITQMYNVSCIYYNI